MIHVGRGFIDDRAPRPVRRGLERWERISRGETADALAIEVLRQREHFKLTPGDVRGLDRWVDRVYAAAFGAVSPVGCGAEALLGPPSLVKSVPAACWFRLDMGVTLTTGYVNNLSELSGWSGRALSQSGGNTVQPQYVANEVTLNSRAYAYFDGSNDRLLNSGGFNWPLTSTTPHYYWSILKIFTWQNGRNLWSGGTNSPVLYASPTSPSLRMHAGSIGPSAATTLSAWRRVATQYTNSIADTIQCGSASGTAVSAGPGLLSTNFAIGNAYSTATAHNCGFAEVYASLGIPLTYERALLDVYATNYYGSGLV